VLVVAGCGGGGKKSTTGPAPGSKNSNVNAVGSPVKGGTLRLLGSSDVDHLDTASAYYTVSYTVERAFTRQLFSYPSSTDTDTANTLTADLATELPTKGNGGISSDGLTYTVHLRSGVMWNTSPARAVTAQDEVLGMKRLCNPTKNAVGAPGYYIGVIAGFKEYCDGFAKVKPTVTDLKAYITGHEISGVTATDKSTVQFKLVRPANDFLNILAMPFASPAPQEYLQYLPDDGKFRSHTISDGPYAITGYTANQSIVLEKNPAWKQSTDHIRHQYVDRIQITQGQDEGPVQQQIQAGTADMSWDTVVPTANVPALKSANDPRLGIFPDGGSNPFLTFNLQSPNNNGALGKVAVRRALQYAIDKVAIGKIYGGSSLNAPLDQVIPPGSVGYQQFNLYPTPGHRGDPAKCKSQLAAAGYPNGLTLKDFVRNAGKHPAVAQSVQADLKKCGVTVKLIPVSQGDYYGKYLADVNGAKAGAWDITEPGWIPDWGGNNGRTTVVPLFDGRTYGPGSTDWGDYNSPATNALIDKALTAPDVKSAGTYWHQADMQIMKDAAFVPFETQKTALFRSTRVHNAIFLPFSQNYDITQIWLKPTS
jgi:peptide/nickel transport system substrate-binding protein